MSSVFGLKALSFSDPGRERQLIGRSRPGRFTLGIRCHFEPGPARPIGASRPVGPDGMLVRVRVFNQPCEIAAGRGSGAW
mmetsp:Transcript_68696/g.183378  ORF Transcript_68696/g.183378 Transcript_68696/m.183378 type:complete len:80 (-) Transcript_68696:251-490(-)